MTIPIPGDLIEVRSPGAWNGEEAVVVASVIYREADEELKNDRFTLLLLKKEPPFYLTVIVEDKDFQPRNNQREAHAEFRHRNGLHAS